MAASVAASKTHAQSTEPTPAAESATNPRDARGWERKPESPGVLLFPAIGRAIGRGASGLVWLMVAPFRGGLYVEDRYQVSENVRDVLYNDERTAAVIPTLAFASGFGLTFGAKAFHDNVFGDEESVSVSGKYGGAVTQSYQLKAEVPKLLDGRVYLRTRARWEKKGNVLFQGIGNEATELDGMSLDPRASEIETRFAERRILGVLGVGSLFGSRTRELRVGVSVIHNNRDFSALDASQPHTNTADVYDTSAINGFSGFSLTEVTADVELDTTDRAKKPTRALRLRGFAGGVPSDSDFSFAHYGGQVTVEQTLFRPERVLLVRLAHEGVAGKESEIPFTELPRLGGAGLLRGFRADRYRDKLAAVAT